MFPNEPLLYGEQKIEALPIEPSYKDVLDKVLEQNKMILQQNAQIVRMLSSPRLIITRSASTEE